MINFKVLKICFLIATSVVWSIKAECTIKVKGDAPVVSKTLGSKTLVLRNGQNNLILKRGETIRADCPRQISVRSEDYYNGNDIIKDSQAVSSVTFKCDYNSNYGAERLFYTTSQIFTAYSSLSYSTVSIQCVQGKRQLYESNATLPNCQSYTTYVIGTQALWRDPIISASICLDLDNLALKYVKYLPNRVEYEFFNLKERTPAVNLKLSAPIEGFEILFKGSNTFDNTIQLFKKANPLLDLHEFNYSSLLQDSTILGELTDFEFMFKIIWWKNLREGSWKFFFETLKSRTESGTYEVYTGTSGVMFIPSSKECKQLEEFVVTHEGREVQAPAIIWAYLKSIGENKTTEFVIVGHNTPFNSVTNSTEFCKDMCHEIDWLKGSLFNKVHLMPTFGFVECCRADEVKSKLEGFPIDLLKEKENSTEDELDLY